MTIVMVTVFVNERCKEMETQLKKQVIHADEKKLAVPDKFSDVHSEEI